MIQEKEGWTSMAAAHARILPTVSWPNKAPSQISSSKIAVLRRLNDRQVAYGEAKKKIISPRPSCHAPPIAYNAGNMAA